MTDPGVMILARVLAAHRDAILASWLASLKQSDAVRIGRLREAEVVNHATTVLDLLHPVLSGGVIDPGALDNLKVTLSEISRSRAVLGLTPTDTATFVFSLKDAIFNAVAADRPDDYLAAILTASKLIDKLGLHTMEVFQTSREEIIKRQSQEIADLSTPVVRLWDGILALPLIGTLDSSRTGVVMENLLQAIVDEEADIAIIDITGVPTVDTLVAQHLLKTIAAARLMGADCIISGIRPQIAQTMVHLGVELNVVSKATLADAFKLALRRLGRSVGDASS